MTENHQPPANTVEAVIRERLAVAVGGWRGSLEAALPTVAFVAVWTATKNLNQALIAAAVVLAVALVLRLVQRQTVKFVVAAAFATAFAAFLAKRSGNASDVFLPGLIQAGVMLAISIASIVVRWPLVGFIVAGGDPNLKDDPTAWQRSRAMVKVCTRLTWVFAALFAVRLAVMLPLYLADPVTMLGVAKIALGWPLYLAALALMALLLLRGETPLDTHDALLHDDREGHERLEPEAREHGADDADEHALGRQGEVGDAAAAVGGVEGERELHHRGLALLELEEAHEVADADGLLDERRHEARGGDGDVDAPALVEHPLVARVVDAGHGTRHAELRLREQGDDEVDLVVTGGADDDVGVLELCLLERGHLARVSEEPRGVRDGLDALLAGVLVDDEQAMFVAQQFAGDGSADASGPDDDDAHDVPLSARARAGS